MFEQLSSIDWQALSHSHGTAEDVPSRLATLAGPSADDRTEALDYFWEFMLHQGSRYEASPYIVPFLFEILQQPECTIRRDLIDLLLGLAVGYGESFLPYGYDLVTEEQRFRKGSWNGLFDHEYSRAAYYEVHERAEVFASFLDPGFDSETRLSAGFAVAHFAQPLATCHRKVASHLEHESNTDQLHGLILCYGMLARYAEDSPDPEILTPFLDATCAKTLRVSVAIALTTALGEQTPRPATETLYSALAESWELPTPRDDWRWWNEGE